MFEFRPVTQSVLPSYASFGVVAPSPRSSFIANAARPIFPVAFAAMTLSAVDREDLRSIDLPTCCSPQDKSEDAPAPRPVKRLSEESVATIVASLDSAVYESRMRTSGSFGTGSVSINFLTGAEVRGLCKSFFATNGIDLEEDTNRLVPVQGGVKDRPPFQIRLDDGDDQSDFQDREIAKTRGEAFLMIDAEREQNSRLMREEEYRNTSKRVLTHRLLLEMERFLEWLDRNGDARIWQ